MPTVPRSNVTKFPGASADMPLAPSEADLMMALAIMHGKGRIKSDEVPGATFKQRFQGTQPNFKDRLDSSQQGEIEDRRGELGMNFPNATPPGSIGVAGGSR